MKSLYTIILMSLFSLTFALYNVGQTISIAHQSQSSTVCNGEEPNGEDDGSLRLIDYNGDENGGQYYVIHIDMAASW